MCGIIGYVGRREAAPLLLGGLRRLEYRGYDSAGLALLSDGTLDVIRAVGKLSNLEALVASRRPAGCVGLGHTRWATHGKPTEENAHPHADCSRTLSVIHNGIIENHAALRERLARRGHVFRSETDTESAAHLIEEHLAALGDGRAPRGAEALEWRLVKAVRLALREVRGAYALAVLWARAPGVIVAAKTASPLVVGLSGSESFLASDAPAFLAHTRDAVFLEDGELAALRAGACAFFDLAGRRVEKRAARIEWDHAASEKGGWRHFMHKEIHESPEAVERTLEGRLPGRERSFARETGLSPQVLREARSVRLVGCGTAYHAGMVGAALLERLARLGAQAEIASEFRYREPVLAERPLVVAVSQSGETADTLAAMRLAREQGSRVLAVCNTEGSAASREADFRLPTRCGQERGVASTKAYAGQVAALSALALQAAAARGALPEPALAALAEELERLPALLREALALSDQVRALAQDLAGATQCLFIGRTYNLPTALEGALKLKEISYVHAEGYPAGEMKHGPLALIAPGTPVVAVATASAVFDKVVSNIEEARARGARVTALVTRGETRLAGLCERVLELPPVSDALSPALNAVPLQLLAYFSADLRGHDVDQPRNLAKSVTVE